MGHGSPETSHAFSMSASPTFETKIRETRMIDCTLPYPLTSSVNVMPFMEALNVTMLVVDGPSVFSCSIVSLTTDSLPGPDTSTLPRYTSSHAVWEEEGRWERGGWVGVVMVGSTSPYNFLVL